MRLKDALQSRATVDPLMFLKSFYAVVDVPGESAGRRVNSRDRGSIEVRASNAAELCENPHSRTLVPDRRTLMELAITR